MHQRRWMLALAPLLMAASPGPTFFEAGPDRVIFPPQKMTILFDHAYHVRTSSEALGIKGEGKLCDFCHSEVSLEETAAERDLPTHGSCKGVECHPSSAFPPDPPKPPAGPWPKDCVTCHLDDGPGSTGKLLIPEPNIKFSHALHNDNANIECETCHVDVRNKTLATRDDYVTMDRCIACHKVNDVSTACATCHKTTPNGRLQTDFGASGMLKPNRLHVSALHTGDFLREHAVPAQRDKAYCEKCHTQNDCLKCHDGVGRDVRYHPGDWISTHPLRGKKDDFRCQSCHNFQQFCLNCHIRTGVASVGNLETMTSRRTVRVDGAGVANGPHPMAADGWIDRTSRNFHGVFAQRNIKSCASCHQEQFCLTCHASGYNPANPSSPTPGLGGNPHPPGFSAKTASTRTARACLKCHHPADPAWRK